MSATVQKDVSSRSCGTNASSGHVIVPGEPFPTTTKYVIINKYNMEQEVQPGDHLAYTICCLGFTYWHEVLVEKCDWTAGKLTVYQRVKENGKGFEKEELVMQEDLWDKNELCKKYIYDGREIPYDISMKRASEKLKEDDSCSCCACSCDCCCDCCNFGKYQVCCNNCEHTVTDLKTGRKESSQVKNALRSSLGWLLMVALRAFFSALIIVVVDYICDIYASIWESSPTCTKRMARFDVFTIGVESALTVVLHLIWLGVWQIWIFCKKWHNCCDESSIMICDVAGSFVGAFVVIGFGRALRFLLNFDNFFIYLGVQSVPFFILTFYFSVIGKTIGFCIVRLKHECKNQNTVKTSQV